MPLKVTNVQHIDDCGLCHKSPFTFECRHIKDNNKNTNTLGTLVYKLLGWHS